MDDIYKNCSTKFSSSVNASQQFTGELCSLQMCDAILHFDKKLQKTVMVEGILKDIFWMEKLKWNFV